MAAITTRALASLGKEPGKWKSEPLGHNHGAIVFRSLTKGSIAVYYRYMDGKKRVSLSVGRYDEKGVLGLTLKQSREKAGELARLHASGITAIREHVEHESQQKNDSLRQPVDGTFKQLLEAYVASLENEGKASAKVVRNMIKRWVFEAQPELLHLKANNITREDVMRVLIKPTEAGLTRTVNQLRSHLLAAFNRAIDAVGDPSLAATIGTGYDLIANPVSLTKQVRKFENARNRILTDEEFKAYLNYVDTLPFVSGAALKLCVLLGGQRPVQLTRLKGEDVDLKNGVLKLFDGKGRRQQPRVHLLPISREAENLLMGLIKLNGDALFLFTNDQKTPLHVDTLSHRVSEFSKGQFQMRDIRRSIETRLAALRVSKDFRAQIQSHGLTGIQERHYDRHDYMEEKRMALELWADNLRQYVDLEQWTKPGFL
jgi:integrase